MLITLDEQLDRKVKAMRMAIYCAVAIPALLLSGAYISQYGFGLFPCEMCWWQRYPHFAALLFGLFALSKAQYARILSLLSAISIGISGLIGGFHAGVEYGWWEGVTSCAVTAETNGDILESIMNAPLVRCDVVPWELFGISLAGYNFIISTLAAILIITSVLKRKNI